MKDHPTKHSFSRLISLSMDIGVNTSKSNQTSRPRKGPQSKAVGTIDESSAEGSLTAPGELDINHAEEAVTCIISAISGNTLSDGEITDILRWLTLNEHHSILHATPADHPTIMLFQQGYSIA